MKLKKTQSLRQSSASLSGMRRVVLKPVLMALAASFLGACSNIPYAIIDGSRSNIADTSSYNIKVTGIDGKLTFLDETVKTIKPGTHRIRLTTTKPSRPTMKDSKTWLLEALPCKRYIVAAKHDRNKRFTNKYWEVDLIRVEDIGGCKVPDPKNDAEVTAEPKA